MLALKRIVMGLLAVFFLISLSRNLLEYQKNLAFYNDYKSEYQIEKRRNEELKTQYVKTQDAYEFEKTVRNKLNMHKKNEVILVVPEPTPTVVQQTPTPEPNYAQWIDVFFKN